jgi:hypothetical protein
MDSESFTYRNTVTNEVWHGVRMKVRQRWYKDMLMDQATFKIDAIMRPDGGVVLKRMRDEDGVKPVLYDILPIARFIEGLR